MFGYVSINAQALTEAQRTRYQAYYCGLCRALKRGYGNLGRLTLSNDMTFLYALLTSLYEPEETTGRRRCLPHPFKPREYVTNELADYCADMNLALAYHKCRDDLADERTPVSRVETRLLEPLYRRISAKYPGKCRVIEESLQEIARMEREGPNADGPANQTARMLGEVFAWREDYWAGELRQLGGALGRFVYLMDAYDDLEADQKRGRYNPLLPYKAQPDFEEFCKESLTLMIAEGTDAFELLPLQKDADILRNILYSGVWARYEQKRARAQRKTGLREAPKGDLS